MEHSFKISYKDDMLSYEGFKNHVLGDYRMAVISRETSLLGRREVLTGKAKFGIFGDGKEVAQIAMAKYFNAGDFRSGYYRDQTFMFATGLASVEQFFSQLYADSDLKNEPFSGGRQMVAHFSTRFVDDNGKWLDLANRKNVTSDISTTAGQMPRALGVAFASKCFRNSRDLQQFDNLSHKGNEISFCTIGDASTSEGHFWEIMNTAGVEQVPLAVFVWDDGYGISVPTQLQTTKGSISEAIQGLQKEPGTNGVNIYKVKAWDYAALCETFETALQRVRDTHTPALFHIEEVTQPQGHSTSGSHERYKTPERLQWERDWDCIKKMKEWILDNTIATEGELVDIEHEAKQFVRSCKDKAWEKYNTPLKALVKKTVELINSITITDIEVYNEIEIIVNNLLSLPDPLKKDVLSSLYSVTELLATDEESLSEIQFFYTQLLNESQDIYSSHLYNESPKSALKVEHIKPMIPFDAVSINGYEVLNKYFDTLFTENPLVFAFGEDLGNIGDVNQGFAGLQKKHGTDRIFDTNIAELSIVGRAIGMSLRGLRPIAEIQYLDYLLYGLQTLSDDVSTTHFRTRGQQSCPLIIRTRGHRLEGIWHSGSPMGMALNALRGMYICVPRNMVQGAGMYNTLLKGNDPALVVECLNGYRLKEKLPVNLLEFTVPLGVPEVIREGEDITIVSYGSTLRIIEEAAERLEKQDIKCEIVDVQTLLPFDIHHQILESLKKTSRILFIDEDVPGGASAYMFNKVMEEQNGYKWIDVAPRTISSQAHRPCYGSDGDYFSKPNVEQIMKVVKEMVNE